MTYSISPKKFSVESDSASKPNNHKSSSLEDSIESSKKLDNLNITEDDALSIEDGDVLIQALCASGSENLLMFTNARQTTLTLNIFKLFKFKLPPPLSGGGDCDAVSGECRGRA